MFQQRDFFQKNKSQLQTETTGRCTNGGLPFWNGGLSVWNGGLPFWNPIEQALVLMDEDDVSVNLTISQDWFNIQLKQPIHVCPRGSVGMVFVSF